jgi:hypothetical protein
MASDGTVYFQCGGTSDAEIDSITIPVEVSSFVQKWVFWAFTKNCDTGEMKIYKDGVCILTGTGMVKTINTPATIYIGSYTPTMNFYSGGIGHISLYNRELSLAEINRIYDYVMGV